MVLKHCNTSDGMCLALIKSDRDLPVTWLTSLLYMVVALRCSHCLLIFVRAAACMSLTPFMLIVVIIAVRDTAINGSYCAIRTSDVCRSQAVDCVAQLSATKFDWDCHCAWQVRH